LSVAAFLASTTAPRDPFTIVAPGRPAPRAIFPFDSPVWQAIWPTAVFNNLSRESDVRVTAGHFFIMVQWADHEFPGVRFRIAAFAPLS
jgi:hypothetical protein